jgi:lysophospholipase L1-like esterase
VSWEGSLLAGAHRVVFLGDSITYSGQYVDDLQMLLRNFPKGTEFEILDLGLPSETVSGLTEPGHANGSFPRPNLHDRLPRLLETVRPDLVIACYGMNDGIYYPFDAIKFEKFQRGVRLLRERVLKAKAQLILMTPPVFDPVPIRNRTLPAGLSEYRRPYEGYNDVLDRYSDWLLDQRTNGWPVIDIHFPMNDYLKQRRRGNPEFVLASDGVHLDDTGHWLIAQALLHGLRIPVYDSGAVVDLKAGKSGGMGDTREFHKLEGEVSFVWSTRPPMPWPGFGMEFTFHKTRMFFPAQGQSHLLIARNGQAPTYRLFEKEELLATLSREDLARGLDTRGFDRLITTDRGRTILHLTHTRNRILSDAWLTFVGHERPGMAKGLPIDEAKARAASVDRQIEELSRPVDLHLRLVALPN